MSPTLPRVREEALRTLRARLRDPGPRVRRVAVMDAERMGDAHALDALLERLEGPDRETDEACLLLIVRALGQRGHRPARQALARLRDDLGAPPRLAHAALLAHDALEVLDRPAPAQPQTLAPEDAEGEE